MGLKTSASMEEYLEALYTLTQDGQTATTSEISRKLNIAPPSVTEMLRKLADGGYINYLPYQGVTLTDKGFALAEKMTRKHRILERFLHDVLKIGNDKVHSEACEMEHSLSDSTERAMCQNLNSPARCPDDEKVIPPCDLDFSTCEECHKWEDADLDKVGSRKVNVTALSSLSRKQKARIAFIRGNKKSLCKLMDMGLTPGTLISVNRIAPLKGPMQIDVRGSQLALGDDIACNIFVEKLAHEPG
jgi:DtxR family transcriptional regulator, Mn-dependent transcriptional regulator